MGDVKLAGVMGLFLGAAVAPAILIALLSGVLLGAVIVARKGHPRRAQDRGAVRSLPRAGGDRRGVRRAADRQLVPAQLRALMSCRGRDSTIDARGCVAASVCSVDEMASRKIAPSAIGRKSR